MQESAAQELEAREATRLSIRQDLERRHAASVRVRRRVAPKHSRVFVHFNRMCVPPLSVLSTGAVLSAGAVLLPGGRTHMHALLRLAVHCLFALSVSQRA